MSKKKASRRRGGRARSELRRVMRSGETLPVVSGDLAGIDLGSREHYVALPPDRGEQVRRFGCFTVDLEQLVEYLTAHRIRTVVMESTGVYWVPLAEVLERRGFEVHLVDARHVKNVSGRKSDVQDCEWIQRLGSYGLLSSAFRPKPEIARLRTYWRQRESLVKGCARQIQLMQKALGQMNVQLDRVVSDLVGQSGLAIVRAIVSGARSPEGLSRLRHPTCKATEDEFVKALTGTYHDEHVFSLKLAVEGYDFHQRQIRECDERVEAHMATMPTRATQPLPNRQRRRRKNQPYFDLHAELIRITGIDLTQIDGLSDLTAQTVITESDIDVDRFPTEKHFASWLGLSPNNRKTGGQVRSRHTRPVASRLSTALRVAARSLHHSRSALGAFYRRLAARIGKAKAVTATARKLACLIYRMRKHGMAYVDLGEAAYEAAHKQRMLRNIRRQAQRFGLELVSTTTGEIPSVP